MIIESSKGIIIHYTDISHHRYITDGKIVKDPIILCGAAKMIKIKRKHIRNKLMLADLVTDNTYSSSGDMSIKASIKINDTLSVDFMDMKIAMKFFIALVDFRDGKDHPEILNMQYVKQKHPECLV